MKEKSTILNITLAILLIFSIVCSFILFNQYFEEKSIFANLQTELGKSRIAYKNAQNNWEALQKNIVGIQKEKTEPNIQLPSGSNKKLSSGMTLYEAAKMIETQRNLCKELGLSAADTKSTLEAEAKNMGTTLAEVDKLGNQTKRTVDSSTSSSSEVKTTTPTKQSTTQTKRSTTTKKSSGTTRKRTTTTKKSSGTKSDMPLGMDGEDLNQGGGSTEGDPGFNISGD